MGKQKQIREQNQGKYIPKDIESKWQAAWRGQKLYEFKYDPQGKAPYYNLVELPYPSGDLHLGHWFSFVIPDAHARYMRMNDRQVFFPNGFDAFGLPAENAAIKRNIHPKDWTMSNIQTMRGQFATMGTMIDWSHQAITSEPSYYHWNQWIFLKMFEQGIAYYGKTLSNWCPLDQTVLANEHVEDGKCWRCGSLVEQKEVAQWFLKITQYADRLLWENTDEKESNGVEWPKSVREGQNNWIGRSEGTEIEFRIKNYELRIKVFTTRPDTLYGATFLVVAPEHEIVEEILKSPPGTTSSKGAVHDDELKQAVKSYIDQAKRKTELDRKEQKEKTGVFAGAYAEHPLTHEQLPIWIADYVLMGYGTGAIMAVPAHDPRDWEFAKKYSLPIRQVIAENDQVSGSKYLVSSKNENIQNTKYKILNTEMENPYLGLGVLINSGDWDGFKVPQEMNKVIDWLEEKGLGKRKVQYHLHDWSVSRQRYWGTPVPMIHCDDCGIVPVPEKDLPVELPYEVDYTPKGKPPLATAEEWLKVKCPKCGKKATRDVETLDTFFDSSWYFYRYVDPKYDIKPFNTALVKLLTPVDIYFGGAEHTLGHTLYARFFTKFFHDIGLLEYEEFAKRRVQHGVILGPDGHRMSKSRGNVVNPDDVVKEYGADTVRLYLAFMMPYDATAPWSTGAISGIYRFLKRIWELSEKVSKVSDVSDVSKEDLYHMHKTIKKVGEDLEAIKFNTAVAAMMEWLNYLSAKKHIHPEEYETLLKLLAPFAPHIAEELWQNRQNVILSRAKDLDSSPAKPDENDSSFQSIHLQPWPKYDSKYLKTESVSIIVQVNGKVREQITVDSSQLTDQKAVEEKAKQSVNVQRHLEGKQVKNVVYVPGKILNFVVE